MDKFRWMACAIICIAACFLLANFALAKQATMVVRVGNAGPTVDQVRINGVPSATVSPTAASTTTIAVSTLVSDANGAPDISTVTAAFTTGSPANGNTVTLGCVVYSANTKNCSGTYDMQFYDSNMTYVIQVTVTDAASSTGTGQASMAYSGLTALDLDASTISFPDLAVGSTGNVTGDSNMATTSAPTIRNTGNIALNLGVNATNLVNATYSSTIGVSNITYSVPGFSGALGLTEAQVNLGLARGASSTSPVNFSLYIPAGTSPVTHTGTVSITGK